MFLEAFCGVFRRNPSTRLVGADLEVSTVCLVSATVKRPSDLCIISRHIDSQWYGDSTLYSLGQLALEIERLSALVLCLECEFCQLAICFGVRVLQLCRNWMLWETKHLASTSDCFHCSPWVARRISAERTDQETLRGGLSCSDCKAASLSFQLQLQLRFRFLGDECVVPRLQVATSAIGVSELVDPHGDHCLAVY